MTQPQSCQTLCINITCLKYFVAMPKNDDDDLPPILPDVRDQLLEYLIKPEQLPIYDYETCQEFWARTPNPFELFDVQYSPLSTTLKVRRDFDTGEIVDFKEVPIQEVGSTAKNSLSMARAPAPPSEATWGGISNFPFMPGGMQDEEVDDIFGNVGGELNYNTNDLLVIPPGFDRGIVFEDDGVTVKLKSDSSFQPQFHINEHDVVDLINVLQKDNDYLGLWKESEETRSPQQISTQRNIPLEEKADLPEEEEVLPKKDIVLNISKPSTKLEKGTEWAILLDTSKPVTNFREEVPEMAIEYEFELDTFQKLAIMRLEKHEHVFVAAHTSAGKTVVAEYAIALSQRHMTRAIYTSPIKALSNQKYRDFKYKFKDVGLVTGDFQINVTATCLIMTTEILRSMLYGGSEITRDLEYVIFDEVHYINDKDRGHVWEQVLIMLPAHVCVVLLSATVPNTIEFADWLGRTYQKKVYVVTTQKRPVPLQHYLYTGTSAATKDNRFLILDANGEFNMGGYHKAKGSFPIKNMMRTSMHQVEKTRWSNLIDHLRRKDLLPVVAFTFSRKRCDSNAEMLKAFDLTSQSEKFHIKVFFNKCIKCLKPPDRELPQIVNMREILTRGIGVHHSGILPIMKEMVEMLFQKQFVKLLFATETFAMGVNMPARTVVFDSIKKHDGQSLRNLLPAEYIQMAGRAGRRGLDKTGTVIILCKKEICDINDLTQIMLGKPSQLKSQFRITYGMVLTLLRVESLSVEKMISRSFHEADYHKKIKIIKQQLLEVREKLESEYTQELNDYMKPLISFYNNASSYLKLRQELMPELLKCYQVAKEVIIGRVLLITKTGHVNKLAVVLQVITKSNKLTYKVLVLTTSTTTQQTNRPKNDLWYKMLGLARENEIFCPDATTHLPRDHTILTIEPVDIIEITSKIIKVEAERVYRDWEKRQMERFRDDPLGPSCSGAVQELSVLSINTAQNLDDGAARYLDLLKDLKVNQLDLNEEVVFMYKLKDKLVDYVSCTQVSNFEEHFSVVFRRRYLEEKRDSLEKQLSYSSMTLYPEYEKRIKILRQLNYVNDQNRVELKGKVACEMGSNELLITELVLRNILADFKPAEVAALLSALVFQAKSQVDPTLTPELERGIAAINAVHKEIQNLESVHYIPKISDVTEDLNFQLVEVVYEWANAKPFAEIMELTDVQEGIIVRCIQQLNETICDVKSIARLTGDPNLHKKMEDASTAIKRDIVFAESLYTHENN